MPDFGLPQRNATQDANAGVINPPATKYSASQVATKKKQVTTLDEGVASIGQSLGNALIKSLGNKSANIKEQKQLDAAIRQGQDHAINNIDKNKKRTGWEEAVFGQDVEYREAQKRAVQNSINAEYLKQATELDSYAGESESEYAERLKKGLDDVLAKYPDDEDTRQIVTATWMTSSAKLAAKHKESHYAYNQQQQRDTYSKQIGGAFDTLNVDASLATSPEELQQLHSDAGKVFAGMIKPQGMSDLANREVINERLEYNLRNGNIGAYNLAKQHGWISNLNPVEKKRLDTAISAYDTGFGNQAATLVQETELEALQAATLDDMGAILQTALNSLDTLETRSSGTDKAGKTVATTRTRIQKLFKQYAREAKEREDKQADLDKVKLAIRESDPITRAGMIEEIDPTSTELKDALDVTIIEDVTRLTGSQEQLTESEAVEAIMTNPQVAKSVELSTRNAPTESPLVKRTLETFVNGWTGLLDENNRLNERGVVAMQSVGQFAQDQSKFKSTIGTTTFDKYEIVRRGLSIGQTADMINRDIQAYEDGKGQRGKYGVDWNLGEGESKQDRISSLVNKFTGQYPKGGSLAHYMEEYDRALTIYKGDRQLAESYLRTSAISASLNYNGRVMPNSKHLDKVTEYNFNTLLDAAQKTTGNSASLMTPYLSALGYDIRDKDGKILSNIEQTRNLSMYTVDGQDGFFIDTPDAQSPVRISSDVMKHWAKVVKQKEQFRKLEREMDEKELKSYWDEQMEIRNAMPASAGAF